MKGTQMLNKYEQQLNKPISENIDEKNNDIEDNLTFDEDITQHAREEKQITKDKDYHMLKI